MDKRELCVPASFCFETDCWHKTRVGNELRCILEYAFYAFYARQPLVAGLCVRIWVAAMWRTQNKEQMAYQCSLFRFLAGGGMLVVRISNCNKKRRPVFAARVGSIDCRSRLLAICHFRRIRPMFPAGEGLACDNLSPELRKQAEAMEGASPRRQFKEPMVAASGLDRIRSWWRKRGR